MARIFRLGLLLAVTCAWVALAHAAVDSVALVLSEDSAPYQEFAARFRGVLNASGRGIRLTVLPESKVTSGVAAFPTGTDVVVPVGVRAVEATVQSGVAAPVLATLIPRSAYLYLKKTAGGRDQAFSGIFLDQPLSRRFALIDIALPETRKVGVVLGPESAGELRALQAAAREEGMSLVSERITNADDLLPALKRVLAESEVLLAVPDPLVFNRTTAQSILLTSYRAQNPLVGYSQSYVNAGALLAVYSTPEQIAQQAAELVLRLGISGGVALPAPQYPKYFSVGVNIQVARSMGISVEPGNALLERLLMRRGPE